MCYYICVNKDVIRVKKILVLKRKSKIGATYFPRLQSIVEDKKLLDGALWLGA